MLRRALARLQFVSLKTLRPGIVQVELNRPEKRNSLTLEMGEAFIKTTQEIAADKTVKVVILSGAGESFCSGRDLKISASHTEEQAEEYLKTALQSVMAVFNLPIPVVAAVHGHALGYGLELVMACDVRVAHTKTELAFPETSLGIFPGAGGAVLTPMLFGESKALDWILTGRNIATQEALAVGLISHVSDAPVEKALEVAEQLIAKPPLGLLAAKAIIKRRINRDIDDWMQEAHEMRSRLGQTKDHFEALRAFVEKRQPVFTGE